MKIDLVAGCVSYSVLVFYVLYVGCEYYTSISNSLPCRACSKGQEPKGKLHWIYPRMRSTYGYLLYKIHFLRVVLHVTRPWFGSLGLYNHIYVDGSF